MDADEQAKVNQFLLSAHPYSSLELKRVNIFCIFFFIVA